MNVERPLSGRGLTGLLLLLVTLMPGGFRFAQAQGSEQFPSRSITLVVPFPVGSGTDIGARLLAKNMTEQLGQAVVVDNRPGANGALGSQVVARARPDGYTLIVGAATTHAANYAFYPGKLGYEASSFEIVAGVGMVPLSLFVAADAPWKTLADLVADARKQPGRLVCGSGTTVSQLACEVVKRRASIDLLNVPYQGHPPALNDLMGGQIQAVFSDGASAAPYVEQKRLRVLATAAGRRLSYWPQVPTVVELGMTDLEITSWSAVFAPAGTPEAVLQKLHAAVNRASASPESVATRQRIGSLPMVMSRDEGRRFIASEIERWARFVKDTGLKPE